MVTTAISAFIGAVLSLAVSILIEYWRKPKLRLTIEDPPTDAKYQNAPATDARFVRVLLSNSAMPGFLRWLGRETAVHCAAEIQFYHFEDGAPLFTSPNRGRWAGAEEPISPYLQDGKVLMIFDPAKFNKGFYMDCYPGSKEAFDIAAKFDADEQCYAWSNWSYVPGKGWRDKDRLVPKGRYLVRASVYSAGEKVSAIFELDNSVTRPHFRLMPATQRDQEVLRNRAG